MTDSTDASSPAAQSAQDDEEDDQRRGFWNKLGDWFGPGEDEDDGMGEANGRSAGRLVAPGLPGLSNLKRMRVEDVAIPRVEITSVPLDITRDGLVEVFRESGNSRLPVYENTLDTPVGLIHLKDFALRYGFNGHGEDDFDLQSLVRPLLYAPPSMPIGVLLQKMQTDRRHMALVIDEYGGVDGLVTIEDVIEQVIGSIEDEHDVEEAALWSEEKPGVYLAYARTPLSDFEADVGLTFVDPEEAEEIDTLGGLAFMMAGRVPARGEVLQHDSGAELEVIDADPRRIKRLRVRLPG
ncbi:hemolysin family protein [Tropicimonas sp. IMCC34011]|uniref:hemolysin family protein n=1 Tax=Tropicimonas sp. IMCC34011 TaxID=2248759 RepID=UPI000E27D5F2|nr:hemolysin family protein [Tropicimonas sp. IMCC34011]